MSLIVKCDDRSGCAATREQGDVNNEWIVENHKMRDGSTVRKDLCPAHRPKSERELGAEQGFVTAKAEALAILRREFQRPSPVRGCLLRAIGEIEGIVPKVTP